MALSAWREIHRTGAMIALANAGATLVIERDRPAVGDPDLADVIVRLAPHLAFAAVAVRGPFVERVARSGDERVVVGRYTRGSRSVAYLVTARTPIDVDELVAAHLVDTSSPFDHFAD